WVRTSRNFARLNDHCAVGNPAHAVSLLGLDTLVALAKVPGVFFPLEQENSQGSLLRTLSTHSVRVAEAAREIAKFETAESETAASETEDDTLIGDAYLAGLLHDVGFILIDQYLHKPFTQIVDALTEQSDICGVESKILGFDHAELGQFVGSQWSLPEHLTASIRYHHDPLEYVGEHQQMVYTVALANFFCDSKGLSARGMANKLVPPAEVFHGLGLDKPQVTAIWEQLDQALKAADIMAMVRAG
ncbi:hypothetical protein LCGC14_2892310, partial [marine sediment metagenome]